VVGRGCNNLGGYIWPRWIFMARWHTRSALPAAQNSAQPLYPFPKVKSLPSAVQTAVIETAFIGKQRLAIPSSLAVGAEPRHARPTRRTLASHLPHLTHDREQHRQFRREEEPGLEWIELTLGKVRSARCNRMRYLVASSSAWISAS